MTLNLLDFEKTRLAAMDKTGVDMQILSLSAPGTESFETDNAIKIARKVNDDLYKIIQKHPTRFAGYASLALQDPIEASSELERTVKKLGFKGVTINSHINGEYLDDKKFWGFFEKVQELGVPVYLHPREPSRI